jgi:hypothetical protein
MELNDVSNVITSIFREHQIKRAFRNRQEYCRAADERRRA